MGVEKARCDCEMTGLYLEKNKLIEIDCIVTEKTERLVLDMVARHSSTRECPLTGEWSLHSYHEVLKHREPGQAVH